MMCQNEALKASFFFLLIKVKFIDNIDLELFDLITVNMLTTL